MTQWFIAAERPAHLTCILPLEGCSDAYRENICRGGVPNPPFFGFICSLLYGTCFLSLSFTRSEQALGSHQRENVAEMLQNYPLMNEYWQDKRARISSIQCSAYILASMSTELHNVGSLRAFEDIPHENKWFANADASCHTS
jgi:predicted acyl esterase